MKLSKALHLTFFGFHGQQSAVGQITVFKIILKVCQKDEKEKNLGGVKFNIPFISH